MTEWLKRMLRAMVHNTVVLTLILPTVAGQAWTAFQHLPIGAKITAYLGPGLLAAIGKWARDKYPGALDWLPF